MGFQRDILNARITPRDEKIRHWDNPGQSEKREKKKILRKKRMSKESRRFREKKAALLSNLLTQRIH